MNCKSAAIPIAHELPLTKWHSAWQVNTDLLDFDIEQVKKDVESDNQKGKKKALWDAYKVAAEGHDLEHFKELLKLHEQAMQDDQEQREQKEIQKKEKAEKAAKRKSAAAVDDSDDVDMPDAGDDAAPSAKKAKGSKKRKKDDESDGENDKVCCCSLCTETGSNRLPACKDAKDQAEAEQQDTKGSVGS